MSLFQTRSRNNSTVMGANAPSQHMPNHNHPLHQQHLLSAHQPSLGSSSQQQAHQDGNGSSIDQDYSQQQQQQQQHQLNRPSAAARPQLFSDFFRRYELMIEFSNLRNPHHCPSGLYVMPAADNMNQWFGTLFIHKGYYRNAVFKFQLVIPQDYPDRRPTVHFMSDMFHPLIASTGELALQYQFPRWRPHRDYLFHVLHYVKAVFKKCVLDTIVEKQAVNKEAYRIYRNENKIFAKLAQQRAQLSITESILYDNYPASNSIKFAPLKDEEFVELKQKMMGSASSIGFPASSLTHDKHSMSLESIRPRLAE